MLLLAFFFPRLCPLQRNLVGVLGLILSSITLGGCTEFFLAPDRLLTSPDIAPALVPRYVEAGTYGEIEFLDNVDVSSAPQDMQRHSTWGYEVSLFRYRGIFIEQRAGSATGALTFLAIPGATHLSAHGADLLVGRYDQNVVLRIVSAGEVRILRRETRQSLLGQIPDEADFTYARIQNAVEVDQYFTCPHPDSGWVAGWIPRNVKTPNCRL